MTERQAVIGENDDNVNPYSAYIHGTKYLHAVKQNSETKAWRVVRDQVDGSRPEKRIGPVVAFAPDDPGVMVG